MSLTGLHSKNIPTAIADIAFISIISALGLFVPAVMFRDISTRVLLGSLGGLDIFADY